ncbi:hypothetical protein C8R43DRAFT_961103 [Mycena crocata]|nr:hypothetical protein C8R43DRAFT_961103 [Mycena crocata]
MFDEKIGILVVGETHLSARQANEIREDPILGRRMDIYHSPNPDNPSKRGIAVVLNREITNTRGVKTHYLIPGRVYVPPTQLKQSKNWEISDAAGGLTDHRMVSVILTAPGSPYIGKGRYTIPLFLLRDKEFMEFVIEKGTDLEDGLAATHDNATFIQTGFKLFKDNVRDFARKRAKVAVGALEQKKRTLQNERETLLKSPANNLGEPTAATQTESLDSDSEEDDPEFETPEPKTPTLTTGQKLAAIQRTIDSIVERQRERKRTDTQIRCHAELDRITKFTVRMSKDNTPRDTLTFLQRTDITPAKGSKRSSEMAEIARDSPTGCL